MVATMPKEGITSLVMAERALALYASGVGDYVPGDLDRCIAQGVAVLGGVERLRELNAAWREINGRLIDGRLGERRYAVELRKLLARVPVPPDPQRLDRCIGAGFRRVRM